MLYLQSYAVRLKMLSICLLLVITALPFKATDSRTSKRLKGEMLQTAKSVQQQTYLSPDKAFEFTFPASYKVYTSNLATAGQSYIPVCHDDALVCVVCPESSEKGRFKGTTFGAASFEVKSINAKTEKACTTPRDASTAPEFNTSKNDLTRLINGVRFVHAFSGGAAMSHDIENNMYRGFNNGRCYQLDVNVTYTNFAVYDPGTIKEFTRQDIQYVTADLTKILDSFKILP